MRQVYNHPSIVLWEASNHPNRIKQYDHSESNSFYQKVYNTIYPVDQSRLIAPTTFPGHTHIRGDLGTRDHEGKAFVPVPEYTAPMVTRGSQDAFTGYGRDWSQLRMLPSAEVKEFLESPHRAYFNFEHEESIGQPNWSLVKGKPWYLLQSYEWDYDKGSIGRRLTADEWKESQAWQAFSASESMKKQRMIGYDGFSWCCLHGGANMGTYKKPLIDCLGRAKLAFYANKMAFQRVLAGSGNVDVVYGPDDVLEPVIMNLGPGRRVDLRVTVADMKDAVLADEVYEGVELAAGRSVKRLRGFKPPLAGEQYFIVKYVITEAEQVR